MLLTTSLTVKIDIRDKSNVESDWIMLGVVLSRLAVLIITAIKNKWFSPFGVSYFFFSIAVAGVLAIQVIPNRCSNCGTEYLGTADMPDYCVQCGEDLRSEDEKDAINCACGDKVYMYIDAKYCPDCGATIG